jgi:hypothetical protein
MAGQAVARILLVITLIVTAHIIRPFSLKNVTTQLLYSTRSLAIILPDSARARFDHANQLAMTFSNSLFETGQTARNRATQSVMSSGVVAMNFQPATEKLLKKAKPAVKAAGGVAGVAPGVAPQRWSVAERTAFSENEAPSELVSKAEETQEAEASGFSEEVASTEAVSADLADEPAPAALPAAHILSVAMPVTLPAVRMNMACVLSKVKPLMIEQLQNLPRRIELMFQPTQTRKPDCDQRDGRQIRLIALIDEVKKLKLDALKDDKSIASILECEDEGTDAVAEDEAVVGPEEFAAQSQETEAMVAPGAPVNPRQADSCSMQPK